MNTYRARIYVQILQRRSLLLLLLLFYLNLACFSQMPDFVLYYSKNNYFNTHLSTVVISTQTWNRALVLVIIVGLARRKKRIIKCNIQTHQRLFFVVSIN